jgi:hypothetical protein
MKILQQKSVFIKGFLEVVIAGECFCTCRGFVAAISTATVTSLCACSLAEAYGGVDGRTVVNVGLLLDRATRIDAIATSNFVNTFF